ncbi:response regulator transcription factor [Sandaracinus amylolyticus]|uniref:Two component transcriptional regulator, winged helix family n=1 Tax=Sandaracinus amylolyticus TaxID=927083 RepID=A0A0F6W1W8_9BACT|nr:response regulator transcription factor [Sandaracinus amylolyticus]AKF05165.1 two component transcriptional regulator, winged helix family [Sandaracinus amylolyticus]
MSGRVLVVEDDPELGAEIVRQLDRAGFTPTWLKDGDDALAATPEEYDLVLLDLVLPNAYGLDILKRYRAVSEVPVILLTARDHTADKVRGLSLGADDYVTKPFWPDELLARIRARLRRPGMRREADAIVRAGAIEVDLDARRVRVDGEPVELTRAELDVLATLARRAGHAVSRGELVEEALDPGREGGERTLDVHVSRLRKKLGAEGKRIATVWGIGYRLEIDR